MKIYLITEGSYSDFHIHSAWSTKELAEAHVAILNVGTGGDAGIEEYELDEPQTEYVGWRVKVDLTTGETLLTEPVVLNSKHPQTQPGCYSDGPTYGVPKVKVNGVWCSVLGAPLLGAKGRAYPLWVTAYGNDPEHALKIAHDFRAKTLAELEGIA